MQRYRVVKGREFWHVEPYNSGVSYQFRSWAEAIAMLYPRAPRTDTSGWSEKLREFYGA